jgi:hypothetical protein
MNKITALLVIIITALSFSLGATIQGRAQNKNYTGIAPFAINDRVGFLDQSNGRIYIYDDNVANCVFVGQIQGLGEPINVISANNAIPRN